jgi:hypothetical protein
MWGVAAVAALALLAGAPPAPMTGVDVWGQSSSRAEVAGRPLGSTLHVFRSGKAVRLPTPLLGDPMPAVARRMLGDPGAPELARTRHAGSLYLVPTTHGWVCVQAPTFLTCHRGLLRAGILWMLHSTRTGIAVYGIAADDVARVSLGTRTATVHDNVFFLARRMELTRHLPKTFGTLVVSYRGHRPSARVTIR